MVQTFFEIGDKFYVTLVSDRIIVDSVAYDFDDCFNNAVKYLSGIEIDEAIILTPLQYREELRAGYCMPYSAIVGTKRYSCSLAASDVLKLASLVEKLNIKKVVGVDKFGYLNLLARKDGIYVENVAGSYFYYKRAEQQRAFLYSQEDPGNSAVFNVADLWHPRLLSSFINKEMLSYRNNAHRKHLCLCGFYLSSYSRDYVFDFRQLMEVCTASSTKQKVDETAADKITLKSSMQKYTENTRNRVTSFEKREHSKFDGYSVISSSLNVAAILVMTILVAFSIFCRRDVTSLEAQTSNREVAIENEKARDEILEKVSLNSISKTQITSVEEIIAIKSEATLGEVSISWDGDMECVYYVSDMNYQDVLNEKLAEIATIKESTYEGTVQINGSTCYKIRYLFQVTV